jgi:hypothetical protein
MTCGGLCTFQKVFWTRISEFTDWIGTDIQKYCQSSDPKMSISGNDFSLDAVSRVV